MLCSMCVFDFFSISVLKKPIAAPKWLLFAFVTLILLASFKNSYHNIVYFQYHQFPICEGSFLCLLLKLLSMWLITCLLSRVFHTLFVSAWLTLIVKLLRTFCEECLIKGQCWEVDLITVVIFIYLLCHTFYC